MQDSISTPNIVTKVQINDFLLHVYAYRKLSQSECQLAANMWLKNSKRKSFPYSGSGKVITIFGYSD